MCNPRATFRRFWRPLIGVVTAYAVAAQSLLIVVGGFSFPAHADRASPGFELCLHSGQGGLDIPAGNSDRSGCSHCIFCVATSHHALIGSPQAFRRAAVETTAAPTAADWDGIRHLSAYSIASPRGPPFGA